MCVSISREYLEVMHVADNNFRQLLATICGFRVKPNYLQLQFRPRKQMDLLTYVVIINYYTDFSIY